MQSPYLMECYPLDLETLYVTISMWSPYLWEYRDEIDIYMIIKHQRTNTRLYNKRALSMSSFKGHLEAKT